MTDAQRNASSEMVVMRRRVARLTRLVEITSSLGAQLEPDPLLQETADAATELMDAQLGGLLLLEEGQERIACYKLSGRCPRPPPGAPTYPPSDGVLAETWRRGVPLRLADIRRHPRAASLPFWHPGIGPFLSAPVAPESGVRGAVFVGNGPGGPTFDADDEELLVAIGAQAAHVIETARLHGRAEELGRLEERERIARALHDSLAQVLFSIGLQTDWLIDRFALDEEAGRRMKIIRRLAERAADELRSAIFALRSPYLPGRVASSSFSRSWMRSLGARPVSRPA